MHVKKYGNGMNRERYKILNLLVYLACYVGRIAIVYIYLYIIKPALNVSKLMSNIFKSEKQIISKHKKIFVLFQQPIKQFLFGQSSRKLRSG